MSPLSSTFVRDLRAAGRDLVREFGFLNRTLADSGLSASAVHALIEIGTAGPLTAKQISDLLLLEKSTVSRMVNALVNDGLLVDEPAPTDGRSKLLDLSAAGRDKLSAIHRFTKTQVNSALSPLDPAGRQEILRGVRAYGAALKVNRLGCNDGAAESAIETGYVPGVVGHLVTLHARTYAALAGFGAAFESQVAAGLADFVARLDDPANRLWRLERDGNIVGGIAIDGQNLGDNRAHLRWFILDDALRGAGLGGRLLNAALAFCDGRGYGETHLWTFHGLRSARALYDRHGFRLVDDYDSDRWGPTIREQKFVRKIT